MKIYLWIFKVLCVCLDIGSFDHVALIFYIMYIPCKRVIAHKTLLKVQDNHWRVGGFLAFGGSIGRCILTCVENSSLSFRPESGSVEW